MRCVEWVALSFAVWLAGSAAVAAEPYPATRARPLFSPNRRPLPPPAVAPPPVALSPVAQPPAPPPAVALSGVILGPGVSVALLSRPGSAETLHVALGGQIDGWKLADIHPRAVVLTLGERRVTVTLSDAAPPGASGMPQL